MAENLLTDMMDKERTFLNFTGDGTLTCAARYIQGSIQLPYPSSFTTTVRAIEVLYTLIIILAGLILNTLVIMLVARYKKLQTISFMIALQIVVLDLVLSVTLSTGLLTTIANRWLLGEYVCAINGILISVTAITRTLLMCVVVLDGFLDVFCPYAYPRHKLKVTVSLSVASWAYAVIGSVIMLPGILDCYRFTPILKTCGISSTCSQNCSVFARVFTTSTLPFMILPAVLYAILYFKSRKTRRATAAEGITTASETSRREREATFTFSLLLATLVGVTVPTVTISSILIAVYPTGEFPPAAYVTLLIDYYMIALLIVMDPIAILRHQDVKEILWKINDTVFSLCFTTRQTNERNYVPPNFLAPNEAAPQPIALNEAAPQSTAPNEAAPQPIAPNEAAPQSTAPNEAAPQSTAPNEVAPQSTDPNEAAPQSTAPNEAAPQSTAPNEAAPQSTDLNEAAPQSTTLIPNRAAATPNEAARLIPKQVPPTTNEAVSLDSASPNEVTSPVAGPNEASPLAAAQNEAN
jgi:hypothetical protein